MNPNEFGLYMIILPHEARFCTIFGKIFKENEKSQPLWLTLNDLYFALNMDFQRKKPIFAYKTSYFQFGTLKYIDVYQKYLPEDGDYVWIETRQRHWFGPTKAEISLVWLLGRGNYNTKKEGKR